MTIVVILAILVLEGCASPKRLQAVPSDSLLKAEIPGMPDVRYYAGLETEAFAREGMEAFQRERAHLVNTGHKGQLPPAEFLAISGGGDDGAFGAGLLVGWTAAGNRPQFKGVTGISTGALIAPFAFLGPEYDRVLREVYTNVSAKDIFRPRGIIAGALLEDAMADTTPLWTLLQRHVDEEMLQQIAREHEKGRLLLIGTCDLDARKGVIWNMGKIAATGGPTALHLFRSIMIASAAIPGAFPPVLLDVEVEGRRFQEMHVDGGTVAQVFLYPPSMEVGRVSSEAGVSRERRVYIIRNARIDPEWSEVERRTLSIASRAISSLITSQGIGDLYRMYLLARRDGMDFNLAYIPANFKVPHGEDFDTQYMRKLFDFAHELAVKGYPWAKVPPGFSSDCPDGVVRK